MSIADLKHLLSNVKQRVEFWTSESGEKWKAPYLGDTPCYYCKLDSNYDLKRKEINPCDYCIHNADNKLLELVSKDNPI